MEDPTLPHSFDILLTLSARYVLAKAFVMLRNFCGRTASGGIAPAQELGAVFGDLPKPRQLLRLTGQPGRQSQTADMQMSNPTQVAGCEHEYALRPGTLGTI